MWNNPSISKKKQKKQLTLDISNLKRGARGLFRPTRKFFKIAGDPNMEQGLLQDLNESEKSLHWTIANSVLVEVQLTDCIESELKSKIKHLVLSFR